MIPILPDIYKKLTDQELRLRISSIKEKFGKRLIILGHHYQHNDIVEFADFRGDSLELCRIAAEQKHAELIVFCGVHFMAESADIIAADNQLIYLPDLTAGCPLADFANIDQVENAWETLDSICGTENITPITYVNSDAHLKAFCGRNEGSVCTSSNATSVLKWALNKTEKVFFFPDQHLGRNSAYKIGISPENILLWDFNKPNPEQVKNAQIILWNGYCHVHTFFSVKHVENIRKKYPGVKIIVHPECNEDVVSLSENDGSTGYIIKYVNQAPNGSTIAIGTELNLVNRLAIQHSDKKIIPLAPSLCPDMSKINLQNLCWTLENLGEINIIQVPAEIKHEARIALNRMLKL